MPRAASTSAREAHDALALAALGVVASAAAAWALLSAETRLAGVAVLVGCLACAAASSLAERAGSPRAGFAAEAAERLLDAGSLGALVWASFGDGGRVSALALVALGAGALTAYIRARGRGLGFDVPRWPAYRVVRGIALAAGLVALQMETALWAVVAMDAGVGVARWRSVSSAGEAA